LRRESVEVEPNGQETSNCCCNAECPPSEAKRCRARLLVEETSWRADDISKCQIRSGGNYERECSNSQWPKDY
jgi:hypothetical protein